jgi:hypothetical protein
VKPFPIVLFAYNRPKHTRLTIESLGRNRGAEDSDLHIFCDGPKNSTHASGVEQVRAYLPSVRGFKSIDIVERDRNLGLANSVIAGVTQILNEHPACIVVEDDMLSSPNFLNFMNEALGVYRNRADIFSVTGYNYPLPIPADYPRDVYLSYRGSSWGWGTWTDRWRKVDWAISDYPRFAEDPVEQALFARGGDDLPGMLKMQMKGKLDSWAIRFDYAHHKHSAFCVHAVRSKIQNIGFDGSGVHCGVSDDYKIDLDAGDGAFRLPPDLNVDPSVLSIFDRRFRRGRGETVSAIGLLSRATRKARKLARGIFAGA